MQYPFKFSKSALVQEGRRQEAGGRKEESLYRQRFSLFEQVGYFRRSVLAIVIALYLLFLAQPALAFSDTKTHWANACIDQLKSRNLVSGYPDGRFQPNSTITRAEFAVLMLNAFPHAEVKRPAIAFKDVPTTHWAYKAIRDAYQRGFFAGYPDGTFQPSQPIPRVQALAVLATAANLSVPEQPEQILQKAFDDAREIPTYAKQALAAATNRRLAVNYPNVRQLKPDQSSTRGEVAAFLCQSFNFVRSIPPEYIAGDQKLFAIKPEMGGIGSFNNGLAVALVNGKYGYIDKVGKLAIAPQYASAMSFAEGFAAVKVGEKWGYIDTKGNVVIPPQFRAAESFSEGLAKVWLDNGSDFIDKTGKRVNADKFDTAYSFSDGVAIVANQQQWSFIDKTGKLLMPLQAHSLSPFSEGLAAINVNGKYGFIDKTGKTVIEPKFEAVRPFSEGLAAVRVRVSEYSERWGYLDKTGKLIIEPQFTEVQQFSEGLAGVQLDSNWGFIDKSGSMVIPNQFVGPENYKGDGVYPFFEGLAMVRQGEKAGFINKTGNFVIQPQFLDASSSSEGLARVSAIGKWVKEVNIGGSNSSPDISAKFEGETWGYISNPAR